MISSGLMDEIIYISLKDQFISKELIEKIVLDIISNCDETTQNLFGGLYFGNVNWDCMIAVVDANNNINANYDKMLELANMENKTYLEKNLKIMSYFFHEIEHVKEEFKKENNTFESKIVKYGCDEYISYQLSMQVLQKINNEDKAIKIIDRKYEKFNEKNWGIIPCERIAEVKARKAIIDSLVKYPGYNKKFFNEYKNLTNFYIAALKMEYCKHEYSASSAPIYRFFSSLDGLKNLKYLLSIKPNLSTETKMMYGFPIKPIEIIEVNKMKIKGRR